MLGHTGEVRNIPGAHFTLTLLVHHLAHGANRQCLDLCPLPVQQRHHRPVHAHLLHCRTRRRGGYLPLNSLHPCCLHLYIGRSGPLGSTAHGGSADINAGEVAQHLVGRRLEGNLRTQEHHALYQAGSELARYQLQFLIEGEKDPCRSGGRRCSDA